MKSRVRYESVVFWLALIGADLVIFLILGLLLMSYDDHYDASKGAYWSLESMNPTEKIVYFSYNGWIIINIVAITFIVLKFYKRRKSNSG